MITAAQKLMLSRSTRRQLPQVVISAVCTAVSTWPTWLALAGLTAAAALLRVLPWLANYPLHPDEALYGAWARLITSGRDPLLLTSWIDKPPLSIYLAAGSIAALGPSELALRLPGMVASILTIPVTYAVARRAYSENTARLAATLLAVSPFAILFAPTAFTDPWLALWLMCAAWAGLAKHGAAAGVALGLAVASKQQGLLGIPLVIGLLLMPTADKPPDPGSSESCRPLQRVLPRVLAALLGFAVIVGPLTYWDSLRWHNRPSFWDRSLATYNWLGVAAPAEWPGRAAEWLRQLGYLFGLPALSWLLVGLAAAAGIAAARALIKRRRPTQHHWLDLGFAAYTAGYLALHILVTFQLWDRYLLPLAPLICLLAARGLGKAAMLKGIILRLSATLTLAIALGYGAWLGAAGRIPVGSDHGAYSGITQVAAVLRMQPAETIVYHHSLGWHFNYYLFDAPQERRWYENGDGLVNDAAHTAQVEPERPQWLIATGWEASSSEALRPVLAARGLTLTEMAPVHRPDGSLSFAMYQIVPLATGDGG